VVVRMGHGRLKVARSSASHCPGSERALPKQLYNAKIERHSEGAPRMTKIALSRNVAERAIAEARPGVVRTVVSETVSREGAACDLQR
jgi:hypothetical protein